MRQGAQLSQEDAALPAQACAHHSRGYHGPHAMYFSTIVLVEAGSSGMWRLRQVAAQALEK
jgi:hypothetical protein